MNNFSIVLIPF